MCSPASHLSRRLRAAWDGCVECLQRFLEGELIDPYSCRVIGLDPSYTVLDWARWTEHMKISIINLNRFEPLPNQLRSIQLRLQIQLADSGVDGMDWRSTTGEGMGRAHSEPPFSLTTI